MKIDQARPVAPDASSGVARAARNLGPHGFRNGLRLLTLLREFGGRGRLPLTRTDLAHLLNARSSDAV
jgi:hypothetical protein